MANTIYRVYITCPAEHKTYLDYRTKKNAHNYYQKNQDKTDWYAVSIERIPNLDNAIKGSFANKQK